MVAFVFWPPPKPCFESWPLAPGKKTVFVRFRKLGPRLASVFFFPSKTAQKGGLFFMAATATVFWVAVAF